MKKSIMKKAIIIIIILIMGMQYYISMAISTKYAIKYNEVFGSYDINEVDRYLNEETLITYKGITKSYKELRSNIVKAFEEKKYKMGSSYGNGSGSFIGGVQEVGIQTYVESSYHSNFVIMELECHGLFFYKINSIKSEDSFFGYLFFAKE